MKTAKTWKQKTKLVGLAVVVGATTVFASIGVSAVPAAAQENMRMCYLKHPETGDNIFFKRDRTELTGWISGYMDCSYYYYKPHHSIDKTYGKNIPERDGVDDTKCGNFTKRQELNFASYTHEGVADICLHIEHGQRDLAATGHYWTAEELEEKRPLIE